MDGRYVYSCRVDDSIIPNNLPDQFNGLVFNLRFCNKAVNPNDNILEVLQSFNNLFRLQRHKFLTDSDAMEIILYMALRKANIPERVRYSIIDEAFSFAHSLLNNAEIAEMKEVLPFVVDVMVRTVQGPNESEQEAIARAWSESFEATLGDKVIPPGKSRRKLVEAINEKEAIARATWKYSSKSTGQSTKRNI